MNLILNMNRKIFLFTIVLVAMVSIGISFYFFYNPPCTSVKIIDAFLKVKIIPGRGMIGLNADTDALRFGVVSPGISSSRPVKVQHPTAAEVIVTMKGDLAHWTSISPAQFNLTVGETKEVYFEVAPPFYAAPGEYTGQAVFCIKETG